MSESSDQSNKSEHASKLPPYQDVKNASSSEMVPSWRSMTMAVSGPGFAPISSFQSMSEASAKPGNEAFGLQDRVAHKKKEQAGVGKPMRYERSDFLSPIAPASKEEIKPSSIFVSVKTTWSNPIIRSIPTYYPMERSNRILDEDEHPLSLITERLSLCFRTLGLQVKFVESPAGAALLTPELVEIYLYFWKTGGGKQICVEVQRRKGDSVTFHRYARHILDASSGDFLEAEFADFSDSHYLKAAEKLLRTEISPSAVQQQETIRAIEIAANLVEKDRLDARILGMESLCILTNPRKTNLNTAMLVSRVILLGSFDGEDGQRFNFLHRFVLTILQRRCMGDEDNVLNGMVVEYDSDDEDFFQDDSERRDPNKPPEYYDAMESFVNYGFTILANSLEIMSTFESLDGEPESTANLYSAEAVAAQFQKNAYEVTDVDIFTTLLMELNRAEVKPHNACLAAKCLKNMCLSSQDARTRSLNLGGQDVATRGLEIGKAANARLERECAQLIATMSTV